jgi:hypothetical protein
MDLGRVLAQYDAEVRACPQAQPGFEIERTVAIAIYPKWDKPFVFPLHRCTSPCMWPTQEDGLFEEIGRRLASALSSPLMFRSRPLLKD